MLTLLSEWISSYYTFSQKQAFQMQLQKYLVYMQ